MDLRFDKNDVEIWWDLVKSCPSNIGNNLIPKVNANCSIIVKAIKASINKSTNQIIMDNHNRANKNINKVE